MDRSDIIDEDGNVSIEVGADVSRRKVMKQLGALGAATGVAGIAGCSQSDGTPTDGGGNGGNGGNCETPGGGEIVDLGFSRYPSMAPPGWEEGQNDSGDGLNEHTAVFVLQNTENPFFVPLTAGFNDALNAFGWKGTVRGPGQNASLQDQVNLIQDSINNDLSEGDVLVTTILDTSLYNNTIQTALDNNICVVNGHTTPARRDWTLEDQREQFSYTSPVSGEERGITIPHVGIRDARGGAAMADEMYQRLQDQKPDQGSYTVMLVNDLPDNPAVTRRLAKSEADVGTAQRYFDNQDDVDVYQNQVFTTPQDPEVLSSRNFVVSNYTDEIDAVVCSAFWAAKGTGLAINEGELPGDLLTCGFDVSGLTGTNDDDPIANGSLTFSMYQDPYGQGFMNVPLAWMWLERGIEMKDLEWGTSVVDQNNIEFVTQRRSWFSLLNWQQSNYDAGL
jgi:simple sugar transport system substrate-binding protein